MSDESDRRVFSPWNPTVAHARAVITAVVLATIAVVARRPDLLVLATPFGAVTVWSVIRRPRGQPTWSDRLGHDVVREGSATRWIGTIADSGSCELVTAEMDWHPWTDRQPTHGAVTSSCHDGTASLVIGIRPSRWGRRHITGVSLAGVAPWAAFRATAETRGHRLTALPVPARFDAAAPHPPSNGLVGQYRSSRPGEGSEFSAIRPFRPGDRTRRINWARSLRHGELQVNATWADQDSHIALVVDASNDFGASGGADGMASSLDTSVRAAGAIAEHATRRADRVSLHVHGMSAFRVVPPGSGRQQLRRMLDVLADVRPGDGRHRIGAGDRASLGVHDASLVVMLSPLVDRGALDRAVSLGRRGITVVVIDTLPAHVTTDEDEATALAWRIRLLERRREVRLVRHAGVPVVQWRGPGSLDEFLYGAARRATAPRPTAR